MVTYLPTAMDSSKDANIVELTKDSDYLPQGRRLAQYFRTAFLMSLTLLLAIYSLRSTLRATWLHIAAFSTLAVPCLSVNAIPMVLTWKTQTTLPMHGIDRRRLDRLCITVYASIVLLMLAPLGFLLLLDMAYAVAAIPLLPVGVVFCLLLRKGTRLGLAWGTAQYGPHDDDLRCFFRLAAGVTIPAYAGLFAFVHTHFKSTAHRAFEINPVECFVFYAVTIGLGMMLLTSVPPALYFRQTRAVLVNNFLGTLAAVLLGFVGVAGLMAAAEIVQGFVVMAFIADIVVGCAWFAREHEHEPLHRDDYGVKPRLTAASVDMVLLSVNSFAFTVLMAFYTMHVNGHTFGWQKKACVLAVAAVLVTNLSWMVLQCKAADTEGAAFMVVTLRRVNTVLVVVAVLSTAIVLAEPAITILTSLVTLF